MASIITRPTGTRAVQFLDLRGRRKTVSLGRIAEADAQDVAFQVDRLRAAANSGGRIPLITKSWLADLPARMLNKFAKSGIVPGVAPEVELAPEAEIQLEAFLDGYIQERGDVKKSTATVYSHTRRCLIKYFGADKPIADISPGDADSWRLWLSQHGGEASSRKRKSNKLAENTVRRRCGIAKQFFRVALRRKHIEQNPFADLTCAVKKNTKREHFISRDDAQAVLDECPDTEWQLIFALARYGGLRCPSEHLALRWSDIDWKRNRFTVHSPKTEHHEGKETRETPIFVELRPFLEAARTEASPGTEFVISSYRDSEKNFGTRMARIIRRAGLSPWPKLFQNLRSTRQTELTEVYPAHVVCAWLGNSEVVARKHYLQVTEEHFQKAGACSAALALQSDDAEDCTQLHAEIVPVPETAKNPIKNGSLQCSAAQCKKPSMGDEGLEPLVSGKGETVVSVSVVAPVVALNELPAELWPLFRKRLESE